MSRAWRLEHLPGAPEKGAYVRTMFDAISPRYDLVNRIMTFGLDQGWRRRTFDSLAVDATDTLLDVACGTGDFLVLAESRSIASVGLDFSFGMLSSRRASSPVVQASAGQMPFVDGSFSAVTCGFALRNFVDLRESFSEMHRVLKDGGRLGLLEVSTPRSNIVRAVHGMYFNHVVPLIGGVISSRAAYSYLPQSVAYLPTHAALCSILEEVGFDEVRIANLPTGAAALITAKKSVR